MVAGGRAARARAGMRTGLISNSWGTRRYDRALLSRLFDGIVISGEVGIRKPAPEIYKLGADSIGLAPAACVFVDDLPFNLEPAAELGMATVHHVSADRDDRRARAAARGQASLLAPASAKRAGQCQRLLERAGTLDPQRQAPLQPGQHVPRCAGLDARAVHARAPVDPRQLRMGTGADQGQDVREQRPRNSVMSMRPANSETLPPGTSRPKYAPSSVGGISAVNPAAWRASSKGIRWPSGSARRRPAV